jgi:hypothetical protein
MTSLFIATPAYEGKVHVQYAMALAETFNLLRSENIPCEIRLHRAGSLLVAERNRLNEAFKKSNCTHALLIDSDLGWAPQAVLAMIKHDVDVVGGCYPARGQDGFLFRPTLLENNALKVNEKKLIAMEHIPAGFIMFKRHVIETMDNHFADQYYEPKDPSKKHDSAFLHFNTELRDGEFWGEDFVFCRKIRETGFDIWVDPFIEFDHDGKRGMLMDILTNEHAKMINTTEAQC